MDIATDLIPSHHRLYDKARVLAFSLIRQLELHREACGKASLWSYGGVTSEGEIIVDENTGPWDRAYELSEMVRANPNALAILRAQNRLSLLDS